MNHTLFSPVAVARQPDSVRVAVIGAPYDHNSSFLRGAADAPGAIRQALVCDAAHGWTELGENALDRAAVADLGDLAAGESTWRRSIETAISSICEAGLAPVVFGGDHAITYPVVAAMARFFPDLTIVHFDAHPDCYDDFAGNPYSHASPFARILEAGLASRLISVGIRATNPHLRGQCERFGIEVVAMSDLGAWQRLAPLRGPVYVSFDMDALDPAVAPAVSHWEPGGLTARQAIDILHSIDAPIVGADLVELNPRREIVPAGGVGFTATVAAKLAKEMIGLVLRDRGRD